MYFLYKILRKNRFFIDHYFAMGPNIPTCQRMKMYGMSEKIEKNGYEIIQLASVCFFNDICIINTDKGKEYKVDYPNNNKEAKEIFIKFNLKGKKI